MKIMANKASHLKGLVGHCGNAQQWMTTLQEIKWCQAFCCGGYSAVHKTNTWSKVEELYCGKTNLTLYKWPSHISLKLKLWFKN